MLKDGDCHVHVCAAALKTISQLPEAVQVQLAPQLAAMLKDSNSDVRDAALKTISQLPEELSY